jgi:hypothetical protein
MTLTPRAVLLAAGILFSLPALAYDWDWDDEIASREWRASTLKWASSSHPDEPSPLLLMVTMAPPPREMWCRQAETPSAADCMVFSSRLADWTRSHLKIPASEPIPEAIFSTFPVECATSCK